MKHPTTLRKTARGTKRRPVTLLILVDGEFPKARHPRSPFRGAAAPRRFYFLEDPQSATRNADALTAVLPLDGGLILSELSLGSPRHAVPRTPRRRYTLEAPLNSPRWRLPF